MSDDIPTSEQIESHILEQLKLAGKRGKSNEMLTENRLPKTVWQDYSDALDRLRRSGEVQCTNKIWFLRGDPPRYGADG